MKNLKKLVVFGAFLTATHAHAFETDFAPVQNSGEIEGIELFNGKLIVKSTGNIGGVPTQYMFLSTNTSNFAQSGFATTNMNNLTSMVFDENHIYATRKNDTNHVYRFTVGNDNNLNGIKNDIKVYDIKDASKVLCVTNGVIYVQNQEESNTFAINAEGETVSPPPVVVPDEIATNYVHAVSRGGWIYFFDGCEFKRYLLESQTSITLYTCDILEDRESAAIAIISLDKYEKQVNTYVLADDGCLYQNPKLMIPLAQNVSGISYGPDGEGIIITSTNSEGRKVVSSFSINTLRKTTIYTEPNVETNKFSQKEISSNGIKYTATNKKIGHSIAD